MLFLLLAILCSTLLGFIFKLFPRYGIDTFQAIVFNYFTCVICGILHAEALPISYSDFSTAWMPFALFLGIVFISGFYLNALTVKNFGVTVAQIMQRMSILISVPMAIFFFGEVSNLAKILACFLALAAIVLINLPEKQIPTKENKPETSNFLSKMWIPLTTWFLSGVIEVVFLKIQKSGAVAAGSNTFIWTVFSTAGILGTCFVAYQIFTKQTQFAWKNVASGIVLGVPNYGSMLFLLWALSSNLGGSVVFPINNVGIITLTAVGAVLFFREKLNIWNWLGVFAAVLAVFFMNF